MGPRWSVILFLLALGCAADPCEVALDILEQHECAATHPELDSYVRGCVAVDRAWREHEPCGACIVDSAAEREVVTCEDIADECLTSCMCPPWVLCAEP